MSIYLQCSSNVIESGKCGARYPAYGLGIWGVVGIVLFIMVKMGTLYALLFNRNSIISAPNPAREKTSAMGHQPLPFSRPDVMGIIRGNLMARSYTSAFL